MRQSLKHLYGHPLAASDGEIGHVKDFYFDDQNWTVRYLVADTGSWLPGRLVLISPVSLGSLRLSGRALSVNLTRKQIEDSPAIDLHKPLSRQYEEEFYRYYNWPFYWNGNATWGMSGSPILDQSNDPLLQPPASGTDRSTEPGDLHLRSAQALKGYHIHAGDDIVGHLCDFLMDTESWTLPELVIRTGHRLSGQEVLIPTGKVKRISYDDSSLFLDLSRPEVEGSPQCALDAQGTER